MKWFYEQEEQIEEGCRCLSCWEYTGRWLVDSGEASEGPFTIGTEAEAKALSEYLNRLCS